MPKQITQDEAIAKFKLAHGEKYDYSDVVYKNCTTKVKINCNVCGHTWETKPYSLWNGHCCPRCAKSERYDTESYIRKAKEVHGETYQYTHTVYTVAGADVIITCQKHGNFEISASSHVGGRKVGCRKCATERSAARSRTSLADFVSNANEVHSDQYDYSQVDYKSTHSKVLIGCGLHGFFSMTPASHLQGQGCKECSTKRRGISRRMTQEEFISRSEVVHNFKYDYSLLDFSKHTTGNQSVVQIICPVHNKSFSQTLVDHLHSGAGCPECASYGFKGNLSGKLYILTSGEITKIGITNLKVVKRAKDISRSAGREFAEFMSFHFQDGYIANGVETDVLKLLRNSYEGVKESFDGCSECFLNVDIKQLMQDIVNTAYLKLNPHII